MFVLGEALIDSDRCGALKNDGACFQRKIFSEKITFNKDSSNKRRA